ncbi:sulfite exporter TauE/SafE family protein [Mycoplasma sp. P36-A1]|uniref:sulfite exporter TauE/SafE family protein n=1 Tax=Mycoplasma sp. P36-A1 TaxID=3252900 RepID=UPI003C2BBEC3
MDFDINILFIVLPFIFLGGFVDSIAGGGGVVTWIGFLVGGLPIHLIYGTNKAQALVGTAVSTYNYLKEGHFNKWYIPFATVGAIIGSALGSYMVTITSAEILNLIMILVLPCIGVLMMFNKKIVSNKKVSFSKKKIFVISAIIGLVIGLYDGFIGPGTGTFLIIAFSLCGLSMLEAGGNAKIINLITNLISFIIFFFNGIIIWWLAIPCIITNIIANYFGSKLAIKNGEKIIRPVLIFVMLLLAAKIIFDIVA